MICVLKPAARTSSGMQSPANAAMGFAPNVEYTRLNQTMSGLNFAHRTQDAQGIAHRPHPPTAANREARQFAVIGLLRRILVTKNCEFDVLTAEFLGKMKAVFT